MSPGSLKNTLPLPDVTSYCISIFSRLKFLFPLPMEMELKKAGVLQTVNVQVTLPTKLHNKASIAPPKIAAAVARYMCLVWCISMLHHQWQVWWLMGQNRHLKTLNWHRNTTALAAPQDHILTMYTPHLAVIHTSLRHSWSMLTVAVSRDMWMVIFTSLISRHPGDLLQWWQPTHLLPSSYDLSNHNICSNIRWLHKS